MIFGFKEKRRIKNTIQECIDKVNKNIYNDELWKGRFVVKVSEIKFTRCEDGSGYYASIKIEMLDKQTGLCKYEYLGYSDLFLQVSIFRYLNDFIIKDVKVWEENPRPSIETSVDYRK